MIKVHSQMLYNSLKIIHILSAALLLLGMASCFRLWKIANQTPLNLHAIQSQTAFVILPIALFQLATGFTMISLQHYNLSERWITGSIVGFIIVISTWLGFIYFLLQSKNKKIFHTLQKYMLSICGLTLFTMIFLMANKIV
jgi:uncharacterized membrane protein